MSTPIREMKKLGALLWALSLVLCLTNCGPMIEPAAPRPQSSRSGSSLSIPQILRGTIASEAVLVGYANVSSSRYQPIIAQGYGLVVGLNGTGSNDIGPDLRAHMIVEMTKGGIGSDRTGWGNLSPQALLDSPDTAVVIVQGIIPQAASKGKQFDLRVIPTHGSSTTSLEGGRLYTTELFPDLTMGRSNSQGFSLAQGKGTIFVNPFAEPGDDDTANVSRKVGRILNGGRVIKDMPFKLRLINPSHARAGMLVTAINTRFPQQPTQGDPTARGESDELIRITVPPSFQDRIDEFVELMLYTTIRQADPESVAMSIRRILEMNPTANIAKDASGRWQALGIRVFPIIRELYDYPEERPRKAALIAGAKLGDPIVVPKLIVQAKSESQIDRLQAIQLMERMGLNPMVDRMLREMVDDVDATVRIEAYESLAKRGDPTIQHVPVDDKFVLDIIDSRGDPMVYVTLIGRPRIVLFGSDIEIDIPVLIQTWSNRLMVMGSTGEEKLEIYYRPLESEQGFTTKVAPRLDEFISFLGHTNTIEAPSPGLGLTYGETVGVIYYICRQNMCSQNMRKTDFKAQQDRILAAIVSQQQQVEILDRPEFSDSTTDRFLPQPEASEPTGQGRQDESGAVIPSGRR